MEKIQFLEKFVLALDVADYGEALEIVRACNDEVELFLVGPELFAQAGPSILEAIHKMRKRVFMDATALGLQDLLDNLKNIYEELAFI